MTEIERLQKRINQLEHELRAALKEASNNSRRAQDAERENRRLRAMID